jgi:hypothetical protein
VGTLVGAAVGEEVVGAEVGEMVGDDVGESVGELVGEGVGSPQVLAPEQFPEMQSPFTEQDSAESQPGQFGPPQSTSVSSPFFTLSMQLEAVGEGVGDVVGGEGVGAAVGAAPQVPPSQFSLSQSDPATHT